MFSQYNAASVDVPLFFMQSIFDQWQLPMEAGADIDCGKYNKSYVDFYGGYVLTLREAPCEDTHDNASSAPSFFSSLSVSLSVPFVSAFVVGGGGIDDDTCMHRLC